MNASPTTQIILLADDDLDDTSLFCEALASANSDVICYYTGNGQEVLNKLGELEAKPHLIFLDINMPVMNGWQCLKRLKAHETYKHIPTIIYSTSSHQRDIGIALELGALCFFTKPSDFLQLTKILSIIANNLGPGLVEAIRKIDDSESRSLFTFQ